MSSVRARGFSTALERAGLLRFTEPNRRRTLKQAARDPLSPPGDWRDAVVGGVVAPPVSPTSPLVALIDSQLDLSHPEFGGSNVSSTGTSPPTDEHGTATASVAAAPINGIGIEGVWPGMRAVNLPFDLTCGQEVTLIDDAISRGARVINMSYGSPDRCFSEYVALQYAVAADVLPVAAAGNEFVSGNPLAYPASWPHVFTVAAYGPDGLSSYFSNANGAVDVAAPGESITAAVPPQFDTDGNPDGYQRLDGTSFSSPMAAAAAAWLLQSRPEIDTYQAAQLLRAGAIDLGTPGWDPDTGWGALSIPGALAQPTPRPDVLEPNDDIPWVNGTYFEKADPPIYRGGRRAAISGLLDKFEDPSDVYRVLFPPRSQLRFTVASVFGDPDVAAFDQTQRRVTSHPIARSNRSGRATDRFVLYNPTRRGRSAWIQVYIDDAAASLDAGYRLTITRVPYRR